MKWFTSEPPIDIPILCKFKLPDKFTSEFYVCQRKSPHLNRLTEAGGEQYCWWEIEELEAWTTFEELVKDFENCCPKKLF